MKNVTVTLDEEVARWARIRAAREDTRLSRLVGELFREKMLDESRHPKSVQDYLAQSPRVLKKKGIRIPDREVLCDRPGLR
ncbi:MAG: hypothetical protein JSW39_02295 [Desulfobacterales bacterium]|nr:MAG: hypothetical protein JSW39_02295 [Desulfobacterales bacterium]